MFGVMLLLVLLVQTVSFACPTCKDGLAENDPSGAGLVRGYFWSIVFMMSMPFLILAGLSSYFYFEICRARRQLTAAEAAA
jgi:heme/copper-type cytochrome/quinol oxidase subunit 2